MTEERLKEIKDSIDIQKEFMDMKNYATELVEEEQELYDEVINLKEENERLKKELNKHIKEGMEKDIIIDKAIKYIEEIQSFPHTNENQHRDCRELKKILQGSDKE